MRRGLIVLLTVAGLAAACAPARSSEPPAPTGFDHLAIAASFHTFHLPGTASQITSVAQLDSAQFLLADFTDIYRLTRAGAGYSVTRLTRPALPVWSPAGLTYRDGLIYVADNLGHDVVVLRLTGDTVTLVRRVTDPQMREPLNVAAEADGSIVAADYDGGAVLRFKPDGSLAWRQPLDGAHAVAEIGTNIYVTSAGTHTIVKYDLAGNRLQTGGSYGTSPGRYVFPVGLSSAGNRLLVTDAVNGRVTILDQNLHHVGDVGGNGPGMDALNYPYAAQQIDSGYVIADTYKQRLVLADRNWMVQQQVVFGPFVPAGRQRPLVFATNAHPIDYSSLPGIDVLGELGLRPSLSFTGGFDGTDHVASNGIIHLNFDDARVPIRFVTWAQRVGSAIVVGSPQSSTLEVIDRATGMFAYVNVDVDTWWHTGTLLTPGNLRREITQVISPALAGFANAQQLLAQGVSRQDAYNRALNGGQAMNWGQFLVTPQAQQFLHSGMTKADASAYFAFALRQANEPITELLAVKYLSGS